MAWQDKGYLEIGGPKKNEKKGNLLTSLIPTGGGVAGTLGGAAAGAAIGSVVPIIGTGIGGLVGALLGGAGGSAAGKVAQNAVEGNSNLGEGVLGEAALGGLTALPIGAGARLAQAGLKATTGIGKRAAADLVQEAGIKTIGKGTIGKLAAAGQLDDAAASAVNRLSQQEAAKAAQKAANKLSKTGARLMASQAQVSGAQARQLGLNTVDTFGNINGRTGLTGLDDMAEVGKNLTGNGADSVLDQMTRDAVSSTSGVQIGNLREAADKLIQSKGGLLSDREKSELLKKVQSAGVAMRGGSEGTLSTLANPVSALDTANGFWDSARVINKSLVATPEQVQKAGIYKDLAGRIEDAIYAAPGVSESIPDLARYGRTSMMELAGEAATAGNKAQQQAYLKLADEVGGIKSVKDLRSLKKDFVDLGIIEDLTAKADGARSVTGRDLSNTVSLKGLQNAIAEVASPKLGGVLASAGNRLANPAARASAPVGQSVLGATTRQGGIRLLTADAPQADGGLDTQTPQDLQQLPGYQQPVRGEAFNQEGAGAQTSPLGYSSEQIGQALMSAYAAGDKQAAAQLTSMYELASQMEAAQQPQVKLSSGAQTALRQQQMGTDALDQLEQTYSAAGGGQGLAGNISNLAGSLNLNSGAGAYNDQLAGWATTIGRALGAGAAGSDRDLAAIIDRLPKLTDSREKAALKLASIRQQLQQAQQASLLYGSAGGDSNNNTSGN